MEHCHRLFDRGVVIPAMDDVEVHIIHPQPLEAVVNFTHDVLARKTAAIRTLTHGDKDFRGDDHFIPIGVIC
jgi:hypothetical protein